MYAVLTPAVLAVVALEIAWCWWQRNGYYEFQDSVASLGTAIINQCVNVAVAAAWMPLLEWLSARGLAAHGGGLLPALGLFLGIDFLFYWFHRFGHRTNLGWAAHMPHHSTEELNYAVALRASVTQRFTSFFFYWPMALLGYSAQEVVGMVAFHLVLQLLPHTRVVGRLPSFLESWMNTPSHHRVHHARNERYLDKNYGGFLILWDKLFGTFEPETEPCSYGVTTPPRTWDPTLINVQVWRLLLEDAWAAPRAWDKVRLWFMPTGWRPPGVAARQLEGWKREGRELKFQSTPLAGSARYLVAQVLLGFPVMLLVTRPDSGLTAWQRVAVSACLWWAATTWAAILESRPWAVPAEVARWAVQAGLLLSLSAAGVLAPAWGVAAAGAAVASMAWALLGMRRREEAPSPRQGLAG